MQRLNQREQQVLRYLLKANSAKEIAEVMIISPRTVEYHISNVKKKFECKQTNELIRLFTDLNAM